ncbi:MAG: phage/plasmid replication protein [Pseudohongiella sp.]|nr:phage/plasmid replication protein [Pseudohongiella sp.]
MTHTSYEAISDQLLADKIVSSTQSANATQAYAMKWLHGHNFERNSQYYLHKSRLLQIGIDISIPYDVTRLPPTIKTSQIIQATHLQAPSWYRTSSMKNQLRLVA